MPISKAWCLCPKVMYLRPNFSLCVKVSGEIMGIACKFGVKFEQWGIDEAFLDVTGKVRDWAEAETLAWRLKQ